MQRDSSFTMFISLHENIETIRFSDPGASGRPNISDILSEKLAKPLVDDIIEEIVTVLNGKKD